MEIQRKKTLEALANHNCGFYYEQSTSNFSKIHGSPVAYWASKAVVNDFQSEITVECVSETRIGMATANNDLFMRNWHEVSFANIGFGITSRKASIEGQQVWFPYCKGGNYRKWYGNLDFVVNWEKDGFAIRNFKDEKTGRIRSHNYNLDYIFKPGLTFTAISSTNFACRVMECALFGSGGSGICNIEEQYRLPLLGFLNSKISGYLLGCLSLTMNFEVNTVGGLPFILNNRENEIRDIVSKIVRISKKDWDNFENSWDFTLHPLTRRSSISEAYAVWETECTDRFDTLKANEEELNRIFIDIYGLQDELTPEVKDNDVTVRKADLQRDIKSLISYAVGCMFGRYSLDIPGLTFAGGEWDASKYTTFPADKDNIIPICNDGDYFEDDVVGRFVKFIEVVYGKETLDANLKFIADALGGKGQPKDVIRNYFLNDFYTDHCKIYQKRPIYWQFDSGKKNGFKCLIYMHRYQPDTIARIRTDYVHEQQGRYRTAIADLEKRIEGASSGDRVKLRKQLASLQAQATEIHDYEEKIHHLADKYISIDLDDGVKVNYAKFQNVLAKIK